MRAILDVNLNITTPRSGVDCHPICPQERGLVGQWLRFSQAAAAAAVPPMRNRWHRSPRGPVEYRRAPGVGQEFGVGRLCLWV